LYLEQKRLLEEELEFTADGKVTESEKRHLEAHAVHVRKLLTQLMPRQPLDWVAVGVRIGLAILLFFVLIAPPYTYFRSKYLAPVVGVSSSATGTVSIREYAPEIPASEASPFWIRRDIDGPIPFTHSTDLRGMTAGIVPAETNGQMGAAVFWTEPEHGKLVLRKLVTDEYFRPSATVSSTFWGDQEYRSAVAVTAASGTNSLVAAAYQGSSVGRVAVQSFDKLGQPLVERVDFDLEGVEPLTDIQAVPWNDGWAIITHIPRAPEAPLFDPIKVKVRVLDAYLSIKEVLTFDITGFEVGEFPIVRPSASGYTIVASAHPSIRSRVEPAGDRLFGFQFDKAKTLTRILRLTNIGGQHDFWTTGFAQAGNDIAIGVQNILGWSFDDPTVGYPRDSGRAYLRFFDQSFQLAGTIIVFAEDAVKDLPDQQGVSHLRQTLIGDRMYVAFDMMNNDSGSTGAQDRSVQGMWLRVAR